MIIPKFYGTIKNGKLEMNPGEQNLINSYLMQFKEDQEIEMTIKRKYKKRTQGGQGEETNFNGYWWAVVVRMVADEMGDEDQDYIHHLILIQIGHFKVDKYGNKHPLSTSELSGGEFAELCSRARTWASKELKIYIPEPNEAEWEK
jgi:hypothetical protein